jgi:chemotaxis signal transduction protein
MAPLSGNQLSLETQSKSRIDSMLIITLGEQEIAIPFGKVLHLDNLSQVTPLPFAVSPIEGLSTFNHRPLLHINLATALSLPAAELSQEGKMVVMHTPKGPVSLKVDRVMGFRSAADFSLRPCPVLKIEETCPWLAEETLARRAEQAPETNNQSGLKHPLTVLDVASGQEVITLLTHSIDRIEEIDGACPRDKEGNRVIRLADRLLPAYSLAHLLGNPGKQAEAQALVIRSEQCAWVLAVDRVLGLKKIDSWHALPPSSQRATAPNELWYLNEVGQIKQLFDARQLLGQAVAEIEGADALPQWQQAFSLLSDKLSCEGLRVHSGSCIFILPVTLSRQVIDDLAAAENRIAHRRSRDCQTPFLDGSKLLPAKAQAGNARCNVQISLGSKHSVVLAVDHIDLQSSLAVNRWCELSTLPPAIAMLFDAAAFDEVTGQWMLRVKADLTWKKLLYLIKQSGLSGKVADALLGWLNGSQLGEYQRRSEVALASID